MLKIAIIGPESTGKTALCKQLAAHFQAPWEPEIARTVVENLRRNYTFDDVAHIARLQIAQEKKYEHATDSPYVFFDTELIITKVWFEHCYGKVPTWVTERLQTRFFDFYLLCQPDLPWEYDPVRENGDKRDFFMQWYEKEIIALGTPYATIGGVGEARLQNALRAIENFDRAKRKR